MPRGKRRTTIQRWLDRTAWYYKYVTDREFARRSDGAKKAARTRKARTEGKTVMGTPEGAEATAVRAE